MSIGRVFARLGEKKNRNRARLKFVVQKLGVEEFRRIVFEERKSQVWVEPVYEYREVVRYERGRRYCTRERVCVRPGHWDTVERRVWVPEHFRHEDRQVLVAPGHFEERRERVCVREGYWRTIEDRGGERTSFGFNLRF